MTRPLALLLCFVLPLLLLTIPTPAAAHHSSPTAVAPPPYARNATVYEVSASLCAGCDAWTDSLEFLYYHNLVRLAHWELPLAWSPRLESYARWWAAQRRSDCALRHSFPEGQFALGENIFWGGAGGPAWRPGDAVKDWAAEGVDYSYAANACNPGKDDFTFYGT
ncbi:hypothetical protein PR202_ga02995 [Eleusine coracana subsp. coracana]|uniref:SCP domain-containing protein n=1 Tax=Eleusine coracana subsp. coracana TaxID=191504 RepID=A0AAV5BM95_ELECO|nr:hypothetical protein PR202_ga02995 [Eleusine coracana subsp. coracana]